MNKRNAFLLFFILNCFLLSAQEAVVNQFDDQGKRHGEWMKKFEGTDQTRYEGRFEHGKEVGTFKFYHRTSKDQPTATKTYTKGSDTVEIKFFTEKGNLVSEGKMVDKKKEGTWKYYHKNSDQLMMVENYKNDKLDGPRTTYFPNGNITQKEVYRDGVLHGENLIYGENGTLIQQYQYKNGKLDGLTKVYDAKGKLLSEGVYKQGVRDGIWKFYENGELTEEIKYPLDPPAVRKKQ